MSELKKLKVGTIESPDFVVLQRGDPERETGNWVKRCWLGETGSSGSCGKAKRGGKKIFEKRLLLLG